jgi:RNA polymerase sigma-70 factor (ECF subfamily)
LGSALSESSLIALARSGDDEAFGQLVRLRQTSVRGLLRRCCGDSQLADDLAQETFVRAWKHLGRLESPATFGGWLRQIALNVWLDHARRRNIAFGELPEGDDASGAAVADSGTAIDLERALDALRPPERVCIVLCLREGMSHAEVARATGLPLGTVKSHVARRTRHREATCAAGARLR